MALDFPASPTTGDRVTLNSVIYEFDGAKWVTIRSLFDRGQFVAGTAAEPGFSVSTDANTGLYAPGADQLAFTTGGVERVEFGTSEVVFNDGGIDYDFRIEGDADVNLVFADASTDRIGIGTSAPSVKIDIEASEPYVTLKNTTEEDTDGGREVRIDFEGEQSGGEASTLARIEVSHDGTADDEKGKVVISTNDGADAATPTTAVTIDSAQKVTIAGDLETNTINTLVYPDEGPLSNRNLLYNGEMQVAQRSAAELNNVTSSGGLTYQTLDRWGYWSNASNLFSSNQVEDAPSGFYHSVQLKSLGNNSMGSGGYNTWSQRFEAQDLYRTGIGTANAKDLILSFWVKASTAGTYAFYAMNSGFNYIFTSTYTVNAANTWEHKTITITGPTSNFSATGNAHQLEIGFTLGAGTTYSTSTLNQWQSGNYLIGATGAINLVETIDETLNLTGVQLEVGSKSTPFEHRSFGDELQRCQRYFYRVADGSSQTLGLGVNYTSSKMHCAVPFPVTMRQAPTLDAASGASYYEFIRNGGADYFNSLTLDNRTTKNIGELSNDTEISGTPGHGGFVRTDNAAVFVDFIAEL